MNRMTSSTHVSRYLRTHLRNQRMYWSRDHLCIIRFSQAHIYINSLDTLCCSYSELQIPVCTPVIRYSICTPWVKKDTKLLSITSPNIERFQNARTVTLARKLATKNHYRFHHTLTLLPVTVSCDVSRQRGAGSGISRVLEHITTKFQRYAPIFLEPKFLVVVLPMPRDVDVC